MLYFQSYESKLQEYICSQIFGEFFYGVRFSLTRSALIGLTLPRDSFHIRFFANVTRYIAKVTRLFAILSATKMKVIGFLYYTCSFIFNFKRAPWSWPLLDCVDLL